MTHILSTLKQMKRKNVGGGAEETKGDPDEGEARHVTPSFLSNLPDLVKNKISHFITRDELRNVSSHLSHVHTKEWAPVAFRTTTLMEWWNVEDIALPRLLEKHGHHMQELTVHDRFIQDHTHLMKHLRRALCAGEFKNLTKLSVSSTYESDEKIGVDGMMESAREMCYGLGVADGSDGKGLQKLTSLTIHSPGGPYRYKSSVRPYITALDSSSFRNIIELDIDLHNEGNPSVFRLLTDALVSRKRHGSCKGLEILHLNFLTDYQEEEGREDKNVVMVELLGTVQSTLRELTISGNDVFAYNPIFSALNVVQPPHLTKLHLDYDELIKDEALSSLTSWAINLEDFSLNSPISQVVLYRIGRMKSLKKLRVCIDSVSAVDDSTEYFSAPSGLITLHLQTRSRVYSDYRPHLKVLGKSLVSRGVIEELFLQGFQAEQQNSIWEGMREETIVRGIPVKGPALQSLRCLKLDNLDRTSIQVLVDCLLMPGEPGPGVLEDLDLFGSVFGNEDIGDVGVVILTDYMSRCHSTEKSVLHTLVLSNWRIRLAGFTSLALSFRRGVCPRMKKVCLVQTGMRPNWREMVVSIEKSIRRPLWEKIRLLEE